MKLRNSIKAVLIGGTVAAIPMLAHGFGAGIQMGAWGLDSNGVVTVDDGATGYTQLGDGILDGDFFQRTIETSAGDILFQTLLKSKVTGKGTYVDENYVGFEAPGTGIHGKSSIVDTGFDATTVLATGMYTTNNSGVELTLTQNIAETGFVNDFSFNEGPVGSAGEWKTIAMHQDVAIPKTGFADGYARFDFQEVEGVATSGSVTRTDKGRLVTWAAGDTLVRFIIGQDVPAAGGFSQEQFMNESIQGTNRSEVHVHDEFTDAGEGLLFLDQSTNGADGFYTATFGNSDVNPFFYHQ